MMIQANFNDNNIYNQYQYLMFSGKKQNKYQKQEKYIEEPIQTVDGQIRIKKYVLLKEVGSGSYSKCYLVKNMDSDSTYVSKVIPKKKLQILQKQKLIYEIKIHQSLSHQNIVHLDHWFEDENNQYIFMQYCPNGNLEKKLSEFEYNMNENQIRRYGFQVVQAIAYIHSQNILHRDLKLCNFYLDECNNVKLGDFGFACQLASQYDKKRQTCGTPNYIAPEAISGFGYSFSSDVWAIGVILYRLKYGCCPFQGESVKKTLENVKLCIFKFPSKPKISSQLKDLIQKIFQINYDDRLSTQQILDHKFFQDQYKQINNIPENKQLKQEKRGFSLSKLFNLDKNKNSSQSLKPKQKKNIYTTKDGKDEEISRGRQGIMERDSRNSTSQKKEEPKRSNSCQTSKQIKEIFKNKSKQNLQASNCTQSQKISLNSPYFTMNTLASSANKQRDLQTIKSNRTSLNEYTYSMGLNPTLENTTDVMRKDENGKESSRSNRVNEFIKSHVNSISLKQQLKINKLNTSKNSIANGVSQGNTKLNLKNEQKEESQVSNINSILLQRNQNPNKQPTSNYINGNLKIVKMQAQPQGSLQNYKKKYYLPLFIQQEKDIVIIHYKISIKQIIYSNVGYIMHRNAQSLFKMTGESVSLSQLPKVFKYVIENKIDIKESQSSVEDYQYGQDVFKILQHIPQHWIQLKDGVILKYGHNSNFMVAKIYAQEGFYISDDNTQIMYNVGADNEPKPLDGVVIMRIYSGWIKTYCKK